MLFQQPTTKQSTKAVTSERITTNICKTTFEAKKERYTTRTCYATTAVKTEIHFMHTQTRLLLLLLLIFCYHFTFVSVTLCCIVGRGGMA